MPDPRSHQRAFGIVGIDEEAPLALGTAYPARCPYSNQTAEDLIERGVLSNYADTARQLGLTRARMSQVMHLLLLAPPLQCAILLATPQSSKRQLREMVRTTAWRDQRRRWQPSPMAPLGDKLLSDYPGVTMKTSKIGMNHASRIIRIHRSHCFGVIL